MALGSRQPRRCIHAQVVDEREQVVAGPFLDDLPVGYSIHVKGVPTNSPTSRRDTHEITLLSCLNDVTNRNSVAFGDEVLLGRRQVRQGSDEAALVGRAERAVRAGARSASGDRPVAQGES